MIEIKKNNIDYFINDYFYSRFQNHNTKYNITKKIDLLDHYIWWFSHKRKIQIFKIFNNKHIYFWSEKIYLKNKSFWTCGFHVDYNTNLFDIIKVYKKFIKTLKKNSNIPIIGVTDKKNLFFNKINYDLGFVEINKKNNDMFLLIKNFYKIKKINNYKFFIL